MSRNWRAEDIIEMGEMEEGAERGTDAEGRVAKKEPHTVRILVETVDQPGALAQVAKAIADCQVNISECFVKGTEDQRAHISFALDITEPGQRDQVMSEVGALEAVFQVRQIVTGHRKVAIVAKSGVDEEGRKWAELRNGEIVYTDSTSYRNLTIEAEAMAARG